MSARSASVLPASSVACWAIRSCTAGTGDMYATHSVINCAISG